MDLKELKNAYSKIHCSELTKFLWKQAETHEKSMGRLFSTENEMYQWVRSNLKISVLYKQSLSSRMKTSGTKKL